MLCEICKTEEATVHLTQVVEGTIKKVHLCEPCSKKHGFNLQGPISITDILLGMGEKPDEVKPQKEERAKPVGEKSCPRCHMRRSDFKKTGRFGCADCYEAFADDLPALLKAMHRSDRHAGKIPAREKPRVLAENDLVRLQNELQEAIDREDYELAAAVRDQIAVCRQQLEDA